MEMTFSLPTEPLRSPNSIADEAPYGVVVYRDGVILYANQEAARLLGFDDPSRLMGEDYFALIHPACLEDADNSSQRFQFGPISMKPRERKLIRRDGTALFAEIVGREVDFEGEPALQVAISDISERKEAETRLKESDALNRTLVSGLNSGVVLQDATGRVLALNSAAERILGVSGVDILQRPFDILRKGVDEAGKSLMGEHSPVAEALVTGRPVQGRAVALVGASGPTWLWFSALPLIRDGESTPYAVLSSFEDITQLRNAQAQLYHNANHDVLTGLPNRLYMHRKLEQEISSAAREAKSFAVVFLDLDGFKNVNDSYGHATGDGLIRQVAMRLSLILRDTDWVARLGGDEFVILLGETLEHEARIVAQRILDALTQPIAIGPTEFYTSASVGVAMFPEAGETADELLKSADTAMYCAKAAGRHSFRFFEPSMLAQAQERLWLENNLRRGLDEGQFFLLYQPKADALTGKITGVEALVRWQHPERGLVSPGEFIPFAEDSGFIVPLGRWVLQESCRQAKAWLDKGFEIPVAVNLAARQLRDQALLEDIQNVLDSTGIPPHLLELELTESALVTDEDQANEILDDIRSLGVKLYIDDFGTGYSSLSQIANFSMDALKIDLTFTAKITSDPKVGALVRAIILLAKTLGMRVVAEGVETKQQLLCLQNLGCDQIQGYFLSKPIRAAELEGFFRGQANAVTLISSSN